MVKLLFLLSISFRPAEAAAASSIEDSDSLLMSTTCSTALVPIAQGSQVKKYFFTHPFFTFGIFIFSIRTSWSCADPNNQLPEAEEAVETDTTAAIMTRGRPSSGRSLPSTLARGRSGRTKRGRKLIGILVGTQGGVDRIKLGVGPLPAFPPVRGITRIAALLAIFPLVEMRLSDFQSTCRH